MLGLRGWDALASNALALRVQREATRTVVAFIAMLQLMARAPMNECLHASARVAPLQLDPARAQHLEAWLSRTQEPAASTHPHLLPMLVTAR